MMRMGARPDPNWRDYRHYNHDDDDEKEDDKGKCFIRFPYSPTTTYYALC